MTNIEYNHCSMIPVSRGIQLCASRMDSLSQLHIKKKKEVMKIDYIRENMAANIIYQKNILGLGWSIAHVVKDVGFFCILLSYTVYFTEHLTSTWSIIPPIPLIFNNFCFINSFFSHHSGHSWLLRTEWLQV